MISRADSMGHSTASANQLVEVEFVDKEVLFCLSLALLHSLTHQVEVLLDCTKCQQIVAAVVRPQGHLTCRVVIQGETLAVLNRIEPFHGLGVLRLFILSTRG